MRYCPRCCQPIFAGETTGESGIYKSHDIPDLCEPCFFAEDEEIEQAGTNDLPETLAQYRENIRAMRTTRRALLNGGSNEPA